MIARIEELHRAVEVLDDKIAVYGQATSTGAAPVELRFIGG